MKNKILTLSLVLLSVTAFAGGNHFHPKQIVNCPTSGCTESQIKEAVPKAIAYLADWKKIDTAWSNAKIESVTQKQFKKSLEWVVTLKNNSNETRYVFFGLDGYVTGSNSSGN